LLGLTAAGKRKKRTALVKALDILNLSGFQVVWLNIDDQAHKSHLISITGRLATWLPYIITPFATLESPIEVNVTDYIDAMLGQKHLDVDVRHQSYLS
jgi:hypothetical protein